MARKPNPCKCGTCLEISDVFRIWADHVEKMSGHEKAQLRIELRKQFRVPSRPARRAFAEGNARIQAWIATQNNLPLKYLCS